VAKSFIEDFDNSRPVRPISFTLEVPDTLGQPSTQLGPQP
jgi:hypothetical protein